jgi:hypothetical protein
MITLGGTSVGFNNANSTSVSHPITISGTDTILIVGTTGRVADVTGVTYNSVAMTQLGTVAGTADHQIAWWGLLNPSQGTHDMTVTSASSQIMYIGGVFYNGVSQSGLPTNKSTGTTSVTINAGAGSAVIGYSYGESSDPTAGSGTSKTLQGNGMDLFESSPLIVSAGNKTLNFTNGSHSFGLELLPINNSFLAFF